ncbi:MAG: hypothetical protein QOE55_3623 [Acidobacteriaceae bacterium]|jgi:hypothetical protein|nr:hypothetical protein [Acidobacteriaceae bacterium]
MSALELPAQPVDATQALNLSAGVSKLQGLTWPFVCSGAARSMNVAGVSPIDAFHSN